MWISWLLARLEVWRLEISWINRPIWSLLRAVNMRRFSDRLRRSLSSLQLKRCLIWGCSCTVDMMLLLIWCDIDLWLWYLTSTVSKITLMWPRNLLLRHYLILNLTWYWRFCCWFLLSWPHIHACISFMTRILLQLHSSIFSLISSNAPISINSTRRSRSRSVLLRLP